MTSKLGDELRNQRAAVGKSIEAAAALLGVNKNTLGAYELGKQLPDVDFLVKFARFVERDPWHFLRIRVEEAMAAQQWSQARDAEEPARPLQLAQDDYAYIPRFDARAAAGPALWVDEERILDYMAFRKDWVRRALGVDPRNLVLITAQGDSMEPTIRSGDVLLIDTSVNSIRDDAIYILVRHGEIAVKRLQRFFRGAVAIRSDNPAYTEETLDVDEVAELRVAGRVRWIGRML
jgi:phage repressor protein C with HTH and peptisase S24 domain